ncbi:MAG: FkbM family methyltransferase [Xanthobacteraceae bacterium]|nr:FkbM family methyltransferase [Xanthobacteraceae bacterium]
MNFLERQYSSVIYRLFKLIGAERRNALIEREIASGRAALSFHRVSEAAKKYGVKAFLVEGDYGVFQGSADDQVMIPYYAKHGYWARSTNETIAEFFGDSGGTFIDVGANIGMTTIPISANAKVQCIALEPEPTNFAFLEANISRNCKNGNITAKRLAAFDSESALEFELSPDNPGDHRLRVGQLAGQQNEDDRRTIKIDAAPLDNIVGSRLTAPVAIKIDTQGAEPFVLKGATKTIAAADMLIIEFWPYSMKRMGGDPEFVIRFLESNFSTMALAEGEDAEPSKVMPSAVAANQLRALVEDRINDDNFYVDVVARKVNAR